MKVRADVAVLLRAGATYREIRMRLGVNTTTIARTRVALGIPAPTRRTPTAEEQRAFMERRHPDVAALLRAGATLNAVQAATGVSRATIIRVRRILGIPVPKRAPVRRTPVRTIAETLAHYTRHLDGGHAHWAGPFNGSRPQLYHRQRPLQVRRETFRAHHGRDPEGRVRFDCDDPACIAGAHLTDERIRQANARADDAFDAIFGDGS